MLCPEVWTFPVNHQHTSHQIGNYDNKAKQNVDKFIRSCPFNKMVSLILPDCKTIPAPIKQLIDAGDYYLVRNLKLCDLVRKDFVEAFIKRGTLTGISLEVGVLNGYDNVFAITPDGKLILVVSKDLYQIIGLKGHPAGLSNQNKERFEITIDLRYTDFHEQSKLYNRIVRSLSKPEIDKFDFQLYWEAFGTTVCPSSVAKFFNDCGYEVEQHRIQIQSSEIKNLRIPNQLLIHHHQMDSYLAHAVSDYFAMIMLECETNTYQDINPSWPDSDLNLQDEHSTQAVIMHCKGLLTADLIAKLIEVSSLSVLTSVIFNVNIHDQAPVVRSHGYTITLFDGTKYFLFKT